MYNEEKNSHSSSADPDSVKLIASDWGPLLEIMLTIGILDRLQIAIIFNI